MKLKLLASFLGFLLAMTTTDKKMKTNEGFYKYPNPKYQDQNFLK